MKDLLKVYRFMYMTMFKWGELRFSMTNISISWLNFDRSVLLNNPKWA